VDSASISSKNIKIESSILVNTLFHNCIYYIAEKAGTELILERVLCLVSKHFPEINLKHISKDIIGSVSDGVKHIIMSFEQEHARQ